MMIKLACRVGGHWRTILKKRTQSESIQDTNCSTMGPVTPLAHIAKLVHAQYLLSALGTDKEKEVLSSQPECHEMEIVLCHLLKIYPHMVTSEMLYHLAPPHLRQLCLDSVFKQRESGSTEIKIEHIADVLKRCHHLEQLSCAECTELDFGGLFHLAGAALSSLISVSLDSCGQSIEDSHVLTLLAASPRLRHLSVADTEVTDKVFLLDEQQQLSLETLSQAWNVMSDSKDRASPCSLVSVDVSGCQNFTSTGVRHLCSLAGSTLRSVNISCTHVDFTALLYLSGMSLPDVVQLSLNLEVDSGAAPHLHQDQLQQELNRCQEICHTLMEQCSTPCGSGRERGVSVCNHGESSISVRTEDTQEVTEDSVQLVSHQNTGDSACSLNTPEGSGETHASVAERNRELAERQEPNIIECVTLSVEDVKLDVKDDLAGSRQDPSISSSVYSMNAGTGSEHGTKCNDTCKLLPATTDPTSIGDVQTSVAANQNSLETNHSVIVPFSQEQEYQTGAISPTSETHTNMYLPRQESDVDDTTVDGLPHVCEPPLHSSETVPGLTVTGSDTPACDTVSLSSEQVPSATVKVNVRGTDISDASDDVNSVRLDDSCNACSPSEDNTQTDDILGKDARACLPDGAVENSNSQPASASRLVPSQSSSQTDTPHFVTTSAPAVTTATEPASCADLASKEPGSGGQLLFTPNILSVCFSTECLGGQQNIQLGLACLDRFLTSNSQLHSLGIVWAPTTPLVDQALQVIGQRAPGLKRLSLDYAETISDSAICKLLDKCTCLSKLDLSGAAFISDAGLLPLKKNTQLEELMLSELAIAAPTLQTVAVGIADQLRVLDLAWCENVDEVSINRTLLACSSLTKLNLRQCPVSDVTLGIIGENCRQLTTLGLSCVKDITDAGVTSLVGCLEQLQSVDLSWNLDLTDCCISRLLVSCPWLHTAKLSGLKRITSLPFLPIIADVKRWQMRKTLARNRSKSGAAALKRPPSCHPRRSTSYATSLKHLHLHYCDHVQDYEMEEVAFACKGALMIVNYYGEQVTPKIRW